jgi:hypothetical protein
MECETIRQALAMSTGKKQAASRMGISPRALSYYLAKYPFIESKETHGRPRNKAFDSSAPESSSTRLSRLSP